MQICRALIKIFRDLLAMHRTTQAIRLLMENSQKEARPLYHQQLLESLIELPTYSSSKKLHIVQSRPVITALSMKNARNLAMAFHTL